MPSSFKAKPQLFISFKIFVASVILLYFLENERKSQFDELHEDHGLEHQNGTGCIRNLRNQKWSKALFEFKPDFYFDADLECTKSGGRFPDEPFEVDFSKMEKQPFDIIECFWTSAEIGADGNYTGTDVFEIKAKQALAEKMARKQSDEEYEILKNNREENCLAVPPQSNSAPSSIGNFFCKDELFDEKGRVKMFTGKLNSCEHHKLNKTFIIENGLFDIEAEEANFVIQNYQYPEINYTELWSNFLSGWKINEDVRDSGMKLCFAEPIAYNIAYCLPKIEGGEFGIRLMEPAVHTAPSICIFNEDGR